MEETLTELRPRKRLIWILAGAAVLLLFLIRTAWCSEDAYIAFRVAENFLRGQGLTWNVGERVQNYTDPLFQFLIIAATWLSGSVYWSAIVVSMLLTLAGYFLLLKGRAAATILLATTVLLTSKGFMDFSVSGLENPATHLAVVAFVLVYWRGRDPFWLTFIASLAAVNRMDSAVLFAPALCWLYYRTGWRVWKPALLGAIPFLAWEAFSLFYYGFLFPNTAYAKLNAGIPFGDLREQGLRYIQNAIAWDTVTVLTIVAGIALGFVNGNWPLSLGAILSLVYIVSVGGDYMASRFLTPVFMFCCAIVIQYAPKKRTYVFAICGAALFFGMLIPSPALLTTSDFNTNSAPADYLGVNDERAFAYPATGLLRWRPDAPWPQYGWRVDGLRLRDSGARYADLMPVGIIPYFAGPNVYVYDRGALGDALTARLPMIPGPWRTGHYWRVPPPGYSETLMTGVNQIQDKKLAEYYDHLRKIIRGDLWDPSRWKEIVLMNFGAYDHLLPR